jgi:hypothetical protein
MTATEVADDILRNFDDITYAVRRETRITAGGYYVEAYQIFYCDFCGGVARIAADMAPINPRRPAHEVRIFFDDPSRSSEAAAVAVEVLDGLDAALEKTR